jgi:hypothetical protein
MIIGDGQDDVSSDGSSSVMVIILKKEAKNQTGTVMLGIRT